MATIEECLKNAGVMKKSIISYTGDLGIEVETESKKAYNAPELKYWRVINDGSLRGPAPYEYVLNGPMKLGEIRQALEEIRICNQKFKFEKDSISTSVHVHVNMQRETWTTLANFLVAYLMVENILIKFSGPDRLSNLFCIPANDAEGVIETINYMLGSVAKLMYRGVIMDENRVKYGALNCAPLTKFGSVEIRSFRGETDVDLIYEWVQIIQELKDFSKTRGLTPPRILQLFNDDNEGFITSVFPRFGTTLIRDLTRKQVVDMISGEKNLYYGAKLATITKDWDTFGVPKPKKITTAVYRKHLDGYGQKLYEQNFNDLDFGQRIVVQEMFARNNINAVIAPDLRGDF
jgi:hypothetical protein